MTTRWFWVALWAALFLGGCASDGLGGSMMGQSSDKAKKASELQVQLAQEYLKRGNLEIARDKLVRALELDPYSAQAHTLAGFLNETIKEYVQAELHYRRVVQLLPKSGDMSNNYASFLCKQARYDEAEAMFKRAFADPFYKTPEVALTNAGICAKDAGQLEQGEAYLREALDRSPNSAPPCCRWQQCFMHARTICARVLSSSVTTPQIPPARNRCTWAFRSNRHWATSAVSKTIHDD